MTGEFAGRADNKCRYVRHGCFPVSLWQGTMRIDKRIDPFRGLIVYGMEQWIPMIDLNDLRVFNKVAGLRSFSDAGSALGMPKSSVSRAISRLERDLAIRLFQRTTRDVALTQAGQALYERARDLLAGLEDVAVFTTSLADTPRGRLTISAGIGFGINVLGRQLPGFLDRYPEISVSIDLTSRNAELVSEQVDVAIRMGPLADSALVATRLGTLTQYICAAKSYLDRCDHPNEPQDLLSHQIIDLPTASSKPRPWRLVRGDESRNISPTARVEVNDMLTICALVRGGAGIAAVTAYLCGNDILEGTLERVLPEWSLPPLPVSLVFPSKREVSPAVRVFVDYLRETNVAGNDWLADPLLANGR
ncbi:MULTISPECIES: LysR family transcriptional regulator [unclassified Rhizobium]|uniref:LysR family transcriptional regulator n=1 Tax=unclassified Rhizobium TaxID=2613769 RepID=UPI000DDFFC8B|nr:MULTISPECIES: LysR family transcriptional regulator [unclassified Rhizobium]MBB3289423.1 DNA-binding transcriptional LysR family regulator [Rhizobium sp. BK252]MBB3404365.1 DNA-binding transcriptional LysR family regulator [Rhizobium sp. BK289]MBB3416751.1 DNA-binding transcriptional LysR family regulator [Rhizobium sp. BK284]MBB3484628.1 DNA-binding transcriptional LysR family regulator [Rhizobium sp. BK347]MDK4722930.1 LysR family transcriptional regulator [Rhizobium sp. CNPSo 3968]